MIIVYFTCQPGFGVAAQITDQLWKEGINIEYSQAYVSRRTLFGIFSWKKAQGMIVVEDRYATENRRSARLIGVLEKLKRIPWCRLRYTIEYNKGETFHTLNISLPRNRVGELNKEIEKITSSGINIESYVAGTKSAHDESGFLSVAFRGSTETYERVRHIFIEHLVQ